jgi:hypothetical protein
MIVQFADNKELHKEWIAAKTARKEKLAAYIKDRTGYTLSPSSLFDIQVHPACRDAILRPCLTFTHTCLLSKTHRILKPCTRSNVNSLLELNAGPLY